MHRVQGNQMKEARVFGHNAVAIVPSDSVQITGTTERGVCLYVGEAGHINVIMESGKTALFKNVNAGTFLPILVTHVKSTSTTATDMLAIY